MKPCCPGCGASRLLLVTDHTVTPPMSRFACGASCGWYSPRVPARKLPAEKAGLYLALFGAAMKAAGA